MENRNIQHFHETLVKIAIKQKNKAWSMQFDGEVDFIVPGVLETNEELKTFLKKFNH